MRISIIAAVAENGVIGRDGGLPWRLPEDMKRFKALTMGKPVIMGRKTFESIGVPLPGRPNIVITRSRDFSAKGVHVVHGFKDALDKASSLVGDGDEIMVIGGAEIYRSALAFASRLYLTEVHEAVEGDARFPDFERRRWREASRDRHPGYDFVVLERINDDVTIQAF